MFEFDVFLSYSSKDISTVHALAESLKRDGLRVWFDKWEIQPGDSIPLKIQHGLEKSHILVMCMSPAYFESEWGALEHHTLLFRDPTNKNRRLIPLLIENCIPPDIIAHLAYIDLRSPSDEEYKRLLVSCSRNEQSSINLNSDIQPFKPRYYQDNKEDENQFKREKARKINEEVIKPLSELANKVKASYKDGDYIEFESNSTKIKFNFDEYEFIRLCKKSEIFNLIDDNLNFVYNRDEVINNTMKQIVEYLNNYHKNLLLLKDIVENIKSSNIPSPFKNNVNNFLTDDRKLQLAQDRRKEEFLFKLYVTVITGNKSFNGHTWAVDLNKYNSEEALNIIREDPKSNKIFTKIRSLKKKIVSDIDKLIYELTNLSRQWQDDYIL